MEALPANEIEGLSLQLCQELAGALRHAAFSSAIVAQAEAIAGANLDAVRLPLVWRFLRDLDHPSAMLARLFCYGDLTPGPAIASILGSAVFDALHQAGVLLADSGDLVRSQWRIMPFADLWVASDDPTLVDDPVMGPGATTEPLLRWIDPEGVRFLDVGCGAGSLALIAAARGAREVVGTDIDPRATAFGRFNARLNGSNARFETGDLVDPVRGRTFERIIAQPPFVPQPPDVAATTYLHGGPRGDELTMRLVAALPEVLAPDGRALLRFDAPVEAQPIGSRIRERLGAARIAVACTVRPGHDADLLSIGYAAERHPTLGSGYVRAAQAYRSHLERLGIAKTSSVLCEFRRMDATNAVPTLTLPQDRGPAYGAAEFDELWEAVNVATRSNADLARTRLAAHPSARLRHVQRLAGSEEPLLEVEVPDGRAERHVVNEASAMLLQLLGSGRVLGEAVAAYLQGHEQTPDDLTAGVFAFVRDALVRGLVVAAEDDASSPSPG